MAPTLLSPSSAISRAAPAVSAWTSGWMPCFFRKLRHCDSAWTWLLAVLMPFSADARQRHQAMLDPLEMLGDDLEPGVRQQAVQVGDAAGDRVLDRDDGELGLAGLDRAHGRVEGRARQGRHVGKGRMAGHVGIGAGLALVGDRVAGPALPARGFAILLNVPLSLRVSTSPNPPGKTEKPRYIRDLRRSAARSRGRDRILLTRAAGVLQQRPRICCCGN